MRFISFLALLLIHSVALAQQPCQPKMTIIGNKALQSFLAQIESDSSCAKIIDSLSINEITSSCFPPEIRNLRKLQRLRAFTLSACDSISTIPDSILCSPLLWEVRLLHLPLYRKASTNFLATTSLQELEISNISNSLWFGIEDQLYILDVSGLEPHKLPNLQTFRSWGARFNGIPPVFAKFPKLEVLYLLTSSMHTDNEIVIRETDFPSLKKIIMQDCHLPSITIQSKTIEGIEVYQSYIEPFRPFKKNAKPFTIIPEAQNTLRAKILPFKRTILLPITTTRKI